MEALSAGPVQRYIAENENLDVRELVLKNKALFSIPASKLSEQITSRRKAKDKLPAYYNTAGIIYPPSHNLAQSSSEVTALYKRAIMGRFITGSQASGVDLTGGFGVDTYFLSKKLHKIHYVEPDADLVEIARHNHKLLGAANIEYHCATAEEFLSATRGTFDFIFLDPSRRTTSGKKVHAFADCVPDILRLKNDLFEKTAHVLIKSSPLLDIQAGMRQLEQVSRVFIVSVNNECREVLFLCGKNHSGITGVEAVNLSTGRPVETFEFTFSGERGAEAAYGDPLHYLYEPNASILKAGAFKSVAVHFKLKKIAENTHLYTAADFIDSFPGKIFRIERFVKPRPAEMKASFPEGKGNVTTRNYPLPAEALKKKTGLKDGGEKFLIGFSGRRKKFLVVATRVA